MGQSSSTNSKTALPSANLLIDASDSYVTDVKLRSAAVIPISEYIKKDKYSKNIQRRKQVKKSPSKEKTNEAKEKDGKKGTLETIHEEIKNEKDNKHEDNKKKSQKDERQPNIEDIKKEKQKFIESSFEDIPDKRKWVNEHSLPKYRQSHVRNRKTQTKIHKVHNKLPPDLEGSYTSQDSKESEELMQIYKNDVYPHVYKNRYKKRKQEKLEEQRKIEEEHKREELKKKIKDSKPAPADSNLSFSKTDIKKRPHKSEESTHHITQHHFKKIAQFFKKPKLNNLVVQTNVACVIHPNKTQRFSPSTSEEAVKKPIIKSKKYLSTLLKEDEDNKKYNTYESSSNTSSAVIQRKVNKIGQVTEEHRKFLSARQALTNWKNIHTLRQHRKFSQPNYETYPEDNYKTINRNPYDEDKYNPPRNINPPMEYIVPPRTNRSRAGYREDSRMNMERMDRKMTPLEISNYNYSKMPPHIKMEYISPKEIKERNQKIKYQNHYERPGTPRYEYMEASSYGGYPQQPRYQNYPDYQNSYDARPTMPPNNDRYYRNNPMPEISERNERNMDKEDFIADMERCLQKHQKMASVYSKVQSPNKTTWVQDRYRRWHKVVME